ncbi:hypothetical protein PTKIN_Ptkin06aG0167400 [Pterospermum kingtungense]
MRDLVIAEEEEDDLVFNGIEGSTPSVDYERCLVGTFLTDRALNFNVMKNRMSSIWRPGRGGLWSFDNHLLVLHKLVSGENPLEVPLFFVDFWVQVYNLQSGFMSETVGKALGDYIGKFMAYDVKSNSGIWRSFMRIYLTLMFCEKVFSMPKSDIVRE